GAGQRPKFYPRFFAEADGSSVRARPVRAVLRHRLDAEGRAESATALIVSPPPEVKSGAKVRSGGLRLRQCPGGHFLDFRALLEQFQHLVIRNLVVDFHEAIPFLQI